MKYFLLTSNKDPASRTMRDYLIECESFDCSISMPFYRVYSDKVDEKLTEKYQDFGIMYKIFRSSKHHNIDLVVFEEELISFTNLDRYFNEKCLLIFLSKHSSNSKIPTLTSHFTGNFSSNNSLGGNPYELGITYPTFQKQYMKSLMKMKEDLQQYDLTIEATHHGPTFSSNPIVFIEIGSTEKEWKNRLTASTICKCVLQTIVEINKNHPKEKSKIAIGIGGNHYPQKFNQLILSSNVAFASIASKYNLKYINQEMLKLMKSRSIEQVTDIFFDKKSLGAEKIRLISIAESEGLVINFV